MAELLPKEQELMDRATELDSTKEAAMENMAPEGKFDVGDLNNLVESLNAVLPMFERPPYADFSEDIEGALPTDFVKALVMVSDAAKSSGLDRLSWDITTAENSEDLEAIQVRLDTLAGNQSFITWLKTDTSGDSEPEGPPVQALPAEAPPAPTPDMESLLASRA